MPWSTTRTSAISAVSRGALGGHVVTGSDQDPQRGPLTVVMAGMAQFLDVQEQDCAGDAVGVQGIGLADTAIGAGIHPCGLDNLVASACDGAGQASTVAGDAFDDP